MNRPEIDARVPLIQEADLNHKIVLLRVDHNVVKKGGEIEDPYRIDASIGTLFHIVERGGRPILMTHVGRTRDKKTGQIKTGPDTSVAPVINYLERKLNTSFTIPELPVDPEWGIRGVGETLKPYIKELRDRRLGGLYLPNTRWFEGEEAKGDKRANLARDLAGLADVYVNDAFGSWQPHASTYDVTRNLPSYAGFLMQKELINLKRVLEPERPFVAVVAGSKYDTKIGPIKELYQKVDRLILGGVIYNTWLCAKYGIKVAGVEDSDIELAKGLVQEDEKAGKVVELPIVVEADAATGRAPGRFRNLAVKEFKAGRGYGYFLDAAPESFTSPAVAEVLSSARTFFVNAVMGFTPHYFEGSAAFYAAVTQNRRAQKLFGGGDTLQELRNLCPGLYLSALDDETYYFFTGGGTVLKAIEEGSPLGLDIIKALMENKAARPA
ncbi:MAG: phosphoglycerate kinase [Thermodesulfobacteriota bacterium]